MVGVGGSNPLAPTIISEMSDCFLRLDENVFDRIAGIDPERA